jgi:ATP-dependent Clp protease ATP-binding subunit ClpC
MPKINVYLPDALASAVKEAAVPVSAVCQAALAEAVTRVGRTRQAISLLREPTTPAGTFSRLAEGLQRRMTPRLVDALAVARSGSASATTVSSLDLLRGLLEDGENRAFRLLLAQDIDIDALRDACTASSEEELAPSVTDPGDALFLRLTMPARAACAAALEVSLELGHNYLGCEHMLVGLVAGTGSAAELLGRSGVRVDALRQALGGAITGVVYERSTSTAQSSDTVAALNLRIAAIERHLTGMRPEET